MQVEWWSPTAAGEAALAAGEPRRAPKQRALLERIARDAGVDAEVLAAEMPGWREAARSLVARGWIASSEAAARRAPRRRARRASTPVRAGAAELAGAPALSDAQQAAVDAVIAGGEDRFHAWLLHGITGSGKTEVYLRLSRQAGARPGAGAGAGDRADASTRRALRGAFPVPLALLHSGLNDRSACAPGSWCERHGAPGDRHALGGVRAAAESGLIVIDEEHDASFKQQDGRSAIPRATWPSCARALGFPVVLGSATPSLESLHNA